MKNTAVLPKEFAVNQSNDILTYITEALVEMCHYEAVNAFSMDRMLIKNNLRLTGCSEPNP